MFAGVRIQKTGFNISNVQTKAYKQKFCDNREGVVAHEYIICLYR